jgi:hypothetical protein
MADGIDLLHDSNTVKRISRCTVESYARRMSYLLMDNPSAMSLHIIWI